MNILAIDSSGMVASVAVVGEGKVIGEYTVNYKNTHSQTLLPMIDEVLGFIKMSVNDIDVFAISAGPGSFTGLRIGAATVKGLSLVSDRKIVSVPTLAGLAYNMYGTERIICPMINAKRDRVYTGMYKTDGSSISIVKKDRVCEITELIDEINKEGKSVIFTGDGVNEYENVLKEKLTVDYIFAPLHMREQRAASTGTLAMECYDRYCEGESTNNGCKVVTSDEFEPEYLRESQAERERKKAQNM